MVRENIGEYFSSSILSLISVLDSNIDEAEEEDDNSFNLIKQTLQAPTTTFMTRVFFCLSQFIFEII